MCHVTAGSHVTVGAALTECVCLWADVESSLRVSRCKQIVESLPEHHFAVTHFLFRFLHEVTLNLNTIWNVA